MAGLARLGSWVDDIAAALMLPGPAEYALRLCVEEAVANVVMHGTACAEGDAGEVGLRVKPGPDVLCVTVEDRCRPFDPLQVAAPERPADVASVRVGGLGVHLMRQYAQALGYERVDGVNRLTVTIGR